MQRLLQRIIQKDKAIHDRITQKFPKTVRVIDIVFGGFLDIVSNPLFAIILTLVLVPLVTSETISLINALSIGGAWLIALAWLARSIPIKDLPVPSRFLMVMFLAVILSIGGMQLGRWSTGRWEAHHKERIESIPQVALLIDDCNFPSFPLHIPKGTIAHILRVHPSILRNAPQHIIGVLDIKAPADKERVWPSDEEAAPLPAHALGEPPIRNSIAMECTVRKYGNATIDKIVLPLRFGPDDYNLLIDPLESYGTFDKFSFYLLDACYAELKPGGLNAGLPGILGEFPRTATLHILGESGRKEVPLTVAYRANVPYGMIFLPSTYRHWQDLPPCY